MFVFIDSDSWDLIVRDSASVMHESRKESSIKKNCHKLFSKKTDFKFQVYKKDRSQLLKTSEKYTLYMFLEVNRIKRISGPRHLYYCTKSN